MDIAIMLEGQDGLNWPHWIRIAQAVEDLGFAGLYRSDHFTNSSPPDKDSLELWVSLTWLASHTERIEFGPLVSPVSFRDPVFTARMALQVDSLSGGRLILGLGAGWQEREHEHFGYDLLDIGPRFDRFGEALVVITELMESDDPVSFSGEYYQLRDAILLPRPKRPGGPPVLIGGNGPKYTLPKVAQYADEWNAAFIPPERFKELNARLDHLLEVGGRPAGDVRRSLAQHTLFAPDNARLKEKLNGRKVAELRKRGTIVGTPSGDIVDQIQARAEAGVQRLMLQWLDLDDMDGLEALAQAVL